MKKEINICDQCGKRTDDYYAKYGWIQIEGIGSITISKGRLEDGCAETEFKGIYNRDEVLEFCCNHCLATYFKNLGNGRKL